MATRMEKREVIEAARKMGARVYSRTRWYDNGVRSALEFNVLDTQKGANLNGPFANEYEASLEFLKHRLVYD